MIVNDNFFSAVGYTDVGLHRQQNEDFMGAKDLPIGYAFVVCDGMGGSVGGATASRIAVKSILESLESTETHNVYEAIDAAIKFANIQIYGTAVNTPNLTGMGTTCVVVIFQENYAYIAHVGDSRIYIRSARDASPKLYRLTKDHSFVQGLIDKGLLDDQDAEMHPRKNELSKVLGVHDEVVPTIARRAIVAAKGDIFMLCSDGLCGLVNDMTMQNELNRVNATLEEKAQTLIGLAKNAGGTDNITIQLIEITKSNESHSIFIDQSPPNNVVTSTADFTTNTISSNPHIQTLLDNKKPSPNRNSASVNIEEPLFPNLETSHGNTIWNSIFPPINSPYTKYLLFFFSSIFITIGYLLYSHFQPELPKAECKHISEHTFFTLGSPNVTLEYTIPKNSTWATIAKALNTCECAIRNCENNCNCITKGGYPKADCKLEYVYKLTPQDIKNCTKTCKKIPNPCPLSPK